MDQYTPGEPESQPTAPPAPAAPPPHQPYQPPAGPGQPPSAGQPQQQPAGQPYPQPGPGYYSVPPPPAQQKKGFNWLMCCGITCGCLLIVAIITIIGIVMVGKRFADWGQAFDATATEVMSADSTQASTDAIIVDSRVLSQNPGSYVDQWIAIEGKIEGEIPSGTSFDFGQYGTHNSTTYALEGPLVVLDISNSPKLGQRGDTLRAYGKVAVFDMTKMPLFGGFMEQVMKEAAKNDPSMKDVPVKMVLFYTKDVELVDQPGGSGAEEGGVDPPWEQPKW